MMRDVRDKLLIRTKRNARMCVWGHAGGYVGGHVWDSIGGRFDWRVWDHVGSRIWYLVRERRGR